MKRLTVFLVSLLLIFTTTTHAQLLMTQDFDGQDLGTWTTGRDVSLIEHLHDGTNGYIQVIDDNPADGTSINSPLIAAQLGRYTARLNFLQQQGTGFGLSIHAYDLNQSYVGKIASYNLSSTTSNPQWTTLQCTVIVDSPDIGYVQIRFGSWSTAIMIFQADDAELHFEQIITQDFDDTNLGQWTTGRDVSLIEHLHDGDNGYIQVIDDNPADGTSIISPLIPAQIGRYVARLNFLQQQGSGFGLSVFAYDVNQSYIGKIASNDITTDPINPQWATLECIATVESTNIGYVQIRFGSWASAIMNFQADDAEFYFEPTPPIAPAWEPKYKITPDQTDRLTAADVVGPDDVVYPNWTYAGVEGGIPNTFNNILLLANYDGFPNDGLDDADAFDAAVIALNSLGGGMIKLAQGDYDLMRPIVIQHSNIVIRGQGANLTLINFRYEIANGEMDFFGIADNQTIGPYTNITTFTAPTNMSWIELLLDGTQYDTYHPSQHSGNRSYLYTTPQRNISLFTTGTHTLTAIAYYEDGSTATQTITVNYDPQHVDSPTIRLPNAAIGFYGPGYAGNQFLLASDADRGSLSVTLATSHDLTIGQWVTIRAQETEARRELTHNACLWGLYRNYQLKITQVDGNTLTFDRPLRLDFPVADESYVQRHELLEYCGVEYLSIEQTQDMWLTGVQFTDAANCWAQRVDVDMCGRHPIYTKQATQCQIYDCVFTDAWFKGGGGTAYVGWEKSYDCLMENVTTTDMRHAPLVQWSASGNVIRDSTFNNSDAQWHSGWTHENLMENCVITSDYGNGGYGFGMWASPPEDVAHGPNGPRNVVYNCDVSSPKDALYIGGMNENWLIMHNRFVVEEGSGFYTKDMSFDHIIKGNIFVLKDQQSPMVRLRTEDCSGVEITDNTLYGGSTEWHTGLIAPLLLQNNTRYNFNGTIPPRPQPTYPSIFQWQRDQPPGSFP